MSRAEAHGKHLFRHYGPDLVVHVRLGIYGTFSDRPVPAAEPRGLVRMLPGGRRVHRVALGRAASDAAGLAGNAQPSANPL